MLLNFLTVESAAAPDGETSVEDSPRVSTVLTKTVGIHNPLHAQEMDAPAALEHGTASTHFVSNASLVDLMRNALDGNGALICHMTTAFQTKAAIDVHTDVTEVTLIL